MPEAKTLYRSRISPYVQKLAQNLGGEIASRLMRQFTPSPEEEVATPGFIRDPLHEEDPDIQPIPGILHKYPNKILYLTTDECPVFCRYCTRKRITLAAHKQEPSLEKVVDYLQKHREVQEVIFSGGDPFMLKDEKLWQISSTLASLSHIQFFRYHTRIVTTLPSRFTPSLWELLENLTKLQLRSITLVSHINLAQEITGEAKEIFRRLKQLGFRLLNQAVLLAGVNDRAEILRELMLALDEAGVTPYYLHQLDPVEGSSHFLVPVEKGLRLFDELRRTLPTYLLPRYVQDSKQGKINLAY